MPIELPAIPAGMLVLMGLFAPYAIALINHPGWAPKWKKLVSIVVSLLLAAIVIAIYYFTTGDVIPDWPMLLLLSVLVVQTSYGLLLKKSATEVERSAGLQ